MADRLRPLHLFVSQEDEHFFIDISCDPQEQDPSRPIPISHRIGLSNLSRLHLQDTLSRALALRTPFIVAKKLTSESTTSKLRSPTSARFVRSSPSQGTFWKESLLTAVRDLGCPYTIESSVQLSPNLFVDQRFLIGIDLRSPTSPAFCQLVDLLKHLSFPRSFYHNFLPILSNSDWLHIGFALNDDWPTYKLYCENFQHTSIADPYTRHYAWKYSPLSRQGHDSFYLYYPNFSNTRVISHVSSLVTRELSWNSPLMDHIFSQILLILNLSDLKSSSFDLELLEVSESSSCRHSIDLNFYESKLVISRIYSHLLAIAQYMSLDIPSFHAFIQPILQTNLGHISFGIDRRRQPFFTLYYGATEYPKL